MTFVHEKIPIRALQRRLVWVWDLLRERKRIYLTKHGRVHGALVPQEDLNALLALAKLDPHVLVGALNTADGHEDIAQLAILLAWSNEWRADNLSDEEKTQSAETR